MVVWMNYLYCNLEIRIKSGNLADELVRVKAELLILLNKADYGIYYSEFNIGFLKEPNQMK